MFNNFKNIFKNKEILICILCLGLLFIGLIVAVIFLAIPKLNPKVENDPIQSPPIVLDPTTIHTQEKENSTIKNLLTGQRKKTVERICAVAMKENNFGDPLKSLWLYKEGDRLPGSAYYDNYDPIDREKHGQDCIKFKTGNPYTTDSHQVDGSMRTTKAEVIIKEQDNR